MRRYRQASLGVLILVVCVCAGISVSGQDSSFHEWLDYRSESHGIRICYPSDFTALESAEGLVAEGGVVTFCPTFDPSINQAGMRTNLHEFRVCVGVTDASPHNSRAPEFADLIVLGGREFEVYRFAEGAVGNRYETLSYVTVQDGKRFEITLFLHYGHPDCYDPGLITPFDARAIYTMFERMVHTFSASSVCSFSGMAEASYRP